MALAFIGILLFALLLAASLSAEPVPYYTVAPSAPRSVFETPTAFAVSGQDGDRITLKNYAASVELLVDADKHVRVTRLRTAAGHDLLAQPTPCFGIAGSDDTLVEDGSAFKVDSYHLWHHDKHVEVDFRLSTPGAMRWTLRLYREKPYLEQRFDGGPGWRGDGRGLAQTLPTSTSLRPVMPVNVMKRGFIKGAANVEGRHAFEFVEKCEHVIYDANRHVGLAGFVAGPGGEERMTAGNVMLLDHATPTLGSDDPLGKIVLFPFDGSVERGFSLLRRFVADEYACEGDRQSAFTWNQFWLWQGKYPDWGYHECTAARLLDILPHIQAIGVEMLHIDAGWENGMNRGGRTMDADWQFDPERFPNGFAPIQSYLREHGMGYITHMFQDAINNPDIITRLIEETDLDELFMDQNVNEKTLACVRKIRKQYPDFEVFCHSMCDERRSTSYWSWGNVHYLSDINQCYFGEGTWGAYTADLPPGVTEPRFIDLFTRCASYQAYWVWPYKTIHPPHAGYTMTDSTWDVEKASSLILTTIASRYTYGWGDDPRMVPPKTLEFFLDWTAFWKTFRSYLSDYQHVLPPPDGIHPDGAGHLKGNEGLVFLFNPSGEPAAVLVKDVFWSPELELDPRRPLELSDWTKPLSPSALPSVDLSEPRGELSIKPYGYRVVGVNLDVDAMKKEVLRQRSLLRAKPSK